MAKKVRTATGARYYSREALRLKSDVAGAKMWAVALDRTMFTYFEVNPNCRFEKHRHRSEQITMVLAGELFFRVGRTTTRVGAREVIAIPSNVEHAVFTRDKKARAVDAWSPIVPKYKSK